MLNKDTFHFSNVSHIANKKPKSLPSFVEERISSYYDRVGKLWNGDNLLQGLKPGQNAIHLSSNDYLCLVGEPDLVGAQVAVMKKSEDVLMSAVFLHADGRQGLLENRMAAYLGYENGMITQSGWSANVGLIQCLANPTVPVYLDMMAHASLWEGAHAANAPAIAFMHNDVEHLLRQIKKNGPGVVVVDSLYSTNGSLCPLSAVVKASEENGCVLIVDESHSIGTHGPQGAGLVKALGLSHRVDFITTSLAKTFAGRGGFISCTNRFKEYFLTEARPAIFSSCLLNHELAWFDAALSFIQSADFRRQRLKEVTSILRTNLTDMGYNVSDGSEQIIALEAGTESQLLVLRNALQRRGVFGAVFFAPATPKNRTLMRLTVNSSLTDAEINRVLEACADMRDEVDLQNWSSTRRLRKGAMLQAA